MKWALLLLVALAGLALLFDTLDWTPPPVDPFRDHFELREEVRQHLWHLEQHAFALHGVALPELKRALVAGDPAPWAESVVRATLPRPTALRDRLGAVEVATWKGSGEAVDGEAFAAWLIDRRARLEKPQINLWTEQLVPRDRDRPDGPFDATLDIVFRGRLADGTLSSVGISCAAVFSRVPRDTDDMTGWITECRVVEAVERRAPHFLMEETTEKSGIDSLSLYDRWLLSGEQLETMAGSLASYALDFDGDGRLDLLFCDRRLWLYRGLGDGRFAEVGLERGLEKIAGWVFVGGTVGDFDNDGDEDLLLDAACGENARNVAYENRAGYFRRKEIAQLGASVSHGAVADYDGDGLVDLYVRVAGKRPKEMRARWIGDRTMPEGVLLKNLGGWRFEDVTKKSGVLTGHRDIFGAAWLDTEPDGDPDLFLANHMGENLLFENRGDGTFLRRIVSDGFGGFSMGIAIGDLDDDGDPDAYLANMSSHAGNRIVGNLRAEDYPGGVFRLIRGFTQGNALLDNEGDGRFEERGVQTAGWAYGPALADLDGDGRLDIYCPAGYQSVERGEPDG